MIIQGDAANIPLPDDSVDCMITDPPYGYSFMNKDWDKAVIPARTWAECLRVLKPGAFGFVMSSPRQDVLSRIICNLQDAGFRTDFSSIYWTYASGFPKAANIGKLVDKREGVTREVVGVNEVLRNKNMGDIQRGTSHFRTRNRDLAPEFYKTDQAAGYKSIEDIGLITKPATDAAKALDGAYGGFQPKPAVEVVLVVMKPLSANSFTDQALANGKGVTWLDNCRIPYQGEDDSEPDIVRYNENVLHAAKDGGRPNIREKIAQGLPTRTWSHDQKGRFPANLLVSNDVLNDGKITKSTGGKGSPVYSDLVYGHYNNPVLRNGGLGDSGSYSRYFDLDKWFDATFPFLIVPKASKSEKNRGLDQWINPETEKPLVNIHPTCKPLKLMSWLVALGTRPNDLVLDPFAGSGTTVLAAEMLNRRAVGLEVSAEYAAIARARQCH